MTPATGATPGGPIDPAGDDAPTGLRAVALFEAAKGALAMLAAASLLAFPPETLRGWLELALRRLHLIPDRGPSPSMLGAITAERVHVVAAVIAAYGLLRFIESWGLWRHRLWASWVGAVGAALYLPFELHALWRHPHWLPATILAINLLVVWVLARDLVARRRAP